METEKQTVNRGLTIITIPEELRIRLLNHGAHIRYLGLNCAHI